MTNSVYLASFYPRSRFQEINLLLFQNFAKLLATVLPLLHIHRLSTLVILKDFQLLCIYSQVLEYILNWKVIILFPSLFYWYDKSLFVMIIM